MAEWLGTGGHIGMKASHYPKYAEAKCYKYAGVLDSLPFPLDETSKLQVLIL